MESTAPLQVAEVPNYCVNAVCSMRRQLSAFKLALGRLLAELVSSQWRTSKTNSYYSVTTQLSAVAPSVKRARWYPTFGGGALRDRSLAQERNRCVSLRRI